MKRVSGIWIPDEDTHLEGHLPETPKFQGHATYQWQQMMGVMSQCRKYRTAVDVGAHVGLWSMFLADIFKRVVAFEPSPAHAACWRENVTQANAEIRQAAVGSKNQAVRFHENMEFSMKSHVNPKGGLEVPMVRLDGQGIRDVDLMKFDCEGYDAEAIAGAAKTIRNCRPAIIVEQVEGVSERRYQIKNLGAVALLQKLGYVVRMKIGSDYIMVAGGGR